MFRFLFDENFDHRILRGLRLRLPDLDFVITQESEVSGAKDPRLLAWAADQNLILVTHDINTMPGYAYERVAAGQRMPGVIIVPEMMPIGQAIEELEAVIVCSTPTDYQNQVLHLPI